MKRLYVVSQDSKTGLWYAHMVGYPYIPVIGSFSEKKSDAMQYARMMNYLPNRVEEIERKRKKEAMAL